MSRVYDQWLDSRKHESDEFMHEFEMRTERYLQTEWNPQNYDVFIKALFDADLSAWKDEIQSALNKTPIDHNNLGATFWMVIVDYCTAKAKAKAKQDMEQS